MRACGAFQNSARALVVTCFVDAAVLRRAVAQPLRASPVAVVQTFSSCKVVGDRGHEGDRLKARAPASGDGLKAAAANFLRFLSKSDQLEVPIYQRTYSWTRPECLQLWNDIVSAAHDDVSGHFIGSIVYIDTGIYQVTGANTIEVIDGQQRLTTISLLLLAVARAMDAEGDGGAAAGRKLVKDYLLQDDDVDPGVDGPVQAPPNEG
jgi:Protein of unknown function DUF262